MNTCRTRSTVDWSCPISRLPRSVTMLIPPGTRIGLLTAPGGISRHHRRHRRVELVGAHPAEIAALQRGLALAELRRDDREGRPAPATAPITVSAKRCASAALAGSSIGMKISPT